MSLHCVDKGYSSYQFPFDLCAVDAILFKIQFIPGFESRRTPHPVHCNKTMEKHVFMLFQCRGVLILPLKVTGPWCYRKAFGLLSFLSVAPRLLGSGVTLSLPLLGVWEPSPWILLLTPSSHCCCHSCTVWNSLETSTVDSKLTLLFWQRPKPPRCFLLTPGSGCTQCFVRLNPQFQLPQLTCLPNTSVCLN